MTNKDLKTKLKERLGSLVATKAEPLPSTRKVSRLDIKKVNKLARELRRIDEKKNNESGFASIPAY